MSEEDKKLPPGWEMKKLGDICDIKGGGVTLHPTKGVNPFITVCRRCGADVGVALLGIRAYIDVCTQCETRHYGGAEKGHCMKCDEYRGRGGFTRTFLQEREKLPIELCDKCKEMQAACDKLVAEGGVYFQCQKCGSSGAIKADSEMSKLVRRNTNTPTGPVGIRFDGCPSCEPLTEETTSNEQTKKENNE